MTTKAKWTDPKIIIGALATIVLMLIVALVSVAWGDIDANTEGRHKTEVILQRMDARDEKMEFVQQQMREEQREMYEELKKVQATLDEMNGNH